MQPNIYFLKAAKGIRQTDLAKELQVTQGQVSEWKNGKRPLSPRAIAWTAQRLKIDALEILKAEDIEKNPSAKNWWMKHAAAAIVAGIVVTNFVTPSPAKAASLLDQATVATPNTIYYVK